MKKSTASVFLDAFIGFSAYCMSHKAKRNWVGSVITTIWSPFPCNQFTIYRMLYTEIPYESWPSVASKLPLLKQENSCMQMILA